MFSKKNRIGFGGRTSALVLLTRPCAAAVAIVALLGAMALATTPAMAAFPGQNGKIAFTSIRDGGSEIYVMHGDGSGQTRLTNNPAPATDFDPAYSPDGTKIAFTSERDGNYEIYVMNGDGSEQTRLTSVGPSDTRPAFSPDGTKIAFVSFRDGNPEIYVMNVDGSGQTRLTNNPAHDDGPEFSPDGTKIAFVSDRAAAGNWEIYVMNTDGSGQARLTNNAALDAQPAFSPDGTRIAFTSDRDGNPEIYLMNADGRGQATRLTNNAAPDREPAFSPDGTKIAFTSERDGNHEIYVMNADGSGQTRLTNHAAYDGRPDWGRVPGPLLSISDVSATEGDPPAAQGITTTFFQFTVSLSSPSATEVSVSVTTRDDSASDGSDYGGNSERLVFAPGETSKQFFVPLIADGVVEPDERFFVELGFALGASFADGQGLGTIVDDDNTSPVVTVPADIYATTYDPAGEIVTFAASATDAEDGSLPVTCSPPSGSLFPLGATTVTCTATDSHGDSGSASFDIDVSERDPPVCESHPLKCEEPPK